MTSDHAAHERRKSLVLQSIFLSIDMASAAYDHLVGLLGKVKPGDGGAILSDAWLIVDALNRIRVLLDHSGLENTPAKTSFLKTVASVEVLRNYIQHLDKELLTIVDKPAVVWGNLSWVEINGSDQATVRTIGLVNHERSEEHRMVNPLGRHTTMPIGLVTLFAAVEHEPADVCLSEVVAAAKQFGTRLHASLPAELREQPAYNVGLFAFDMEFKDPE